MSRRERGAPGSLTSREKSRDDHYRNSRDSSSNDRNRDQRRRKDRSRSNDRYHRRSRSRENKNKSDNKKETTDHTDTRVREMSISPTRDGDRTPTPPPAPRISKISIGFNKAAPKPQPIKMTLGPSSSAPNPIPVLKPKLTSVFNDGSDEEPEEMPAEARMRMRNIGRETPTSAGPNSFGKTKHGFCDAKNVFQRNLKEAMEKVSPPVNPPPKFPSTIYKFPQ